MLNLTKAINQNQPILVEVFKDYRVILAYLFGSQARGDAGPLSDVDVGILFASEVPECERFHLVLQLIAELGSIFQRDDVYVVDMGVASPLLRYRVYFDGLLLYCPDDNVRIRFEMTALRDYVDTIPLRRIKQKYVMQSFD